MFGRRLVWCIILDIIIVLVQATTKIISDCPTSKMCPPGWAVQRNKEQGAVNCEIGTKKCISPYNCVASHCGQKFCCGNEKKLLKMKEQAEERSLWSDDGEDEEL